MTEEHTEIGTKLVLDDAASATMSRIRHGMGEVGHKVQEVQGELRGLAKQALATAVGFQFDHGLESLKELGHEAYSAATGAMAQQKALAGVLSMVDKTGASYEDISEKAVTLHEDLENLGVAAGVSSDQLMETFSMIAERSQKSQEAVYELTEEMAFAGKAMSGGVEQLAGAFRDLETGIVRPRNAIVQLMRQTGVVKGTSQQIAKGMAALMQSGNPADMKKAFDLAESAVTRMGEKMRKAPASYAGLITSLQTVRENIYEAMGIPMLKALTPPLNQLKTYFVEHRKEIERWAEAAGKQVGEWLTKAAEEFRKGFEFVQDHAAEIREALVTGATMLKNALEFMVAHRSVLTAISAVNAVRSGAAGAMALGTALAGGTTGAAAAGQAAVAVSSAAAAGALGLLAVNVGLAAVAAYNLFQLSKEYQGGAGLKGYGAQQDIDAKLERMRTLTAGGSAMTAEALAEFDKLRREMVETAVAAKMNSQAIGASADALYREHQARRDMEFDVVAPRIDRAFKEGEVEPIFKAYEQAAKTGNDAVRQYVADLLSRDADLRLAFATSHDTIEGGYDKLTELLSGKGKVDFQKLLATMTPRGYVPESLSFPNATFYIKQDFKDQDPGRVIAMFRSDLVKHATQPMSSQFSDVFGL